MTQDEIQKKHGDMFAEGWHPWFDVGDGWLPIVDTALSQIKWDVEHNKMPKVEINQIKEKFGMLNIYFDGGDSKTCGIIDMATLMSQKVCENCGTMDNLGKTSGWISIMCENCARDSGKLDKFSRFDGKSININKSITVEVLDPTGVTLNKCNIEPNTMEKFGITRIGFSNKDGLIGFIKIIEVKDKKFKIEII